MDSLNFINNNGELVTADQNILKCNNRSFLYGDGLFETMHACGNVVHHVERHYNRLVRSSSVLSLNLPENFNTEMIRRESERMLKRNKYFKGARIRLSVFRNEGGFYSPMNNSVSWVIQGSKLNSEEYLLNKTGFSIDLYEGLYKSVNALSELKSVNSLLYVLAGIYKDKNNLDDIFILNEDKRIVEALSSNVFIFNNDILYTPHDGEGPVRGIMRDVVIELATELGLRVVQSEVTEQLIMNADELFLTNAVKGIQWVGRYKTKRFFNQLSSMLIKELNNKTFGK